MKKIKNTFGRHYLVEYIGCDEKRIRHVREVKPALLKAARLSKATILKNYFYQFRPVGVSGLMFIAESHFSIHTWPEDCYAGLDILTCGEMYPQRAVDYLAKYFKAKKVIQKIIPRGF